MIRFASLVLVVFLAACGGSSTSGGTKPVQPVAGGDPSCPVEIAGTSVTVEDTATGAALVFVTTGDIAEVRRRATTMAQMHNDHHGKMGPLPTGSEPGGGGHAGHDMSGHAGHGGGTSDHAGHGGGMIGVHSKAEVKDIVGGASIGFVAMPNDVGALQSELRMHAQHLSNGTCTMAAHAMHGEPSAPVKPDPAEPAEPTKPDPAAIKTELLAAEMAAFERAKPVFGKFCAKCHTEGGKNASEKKLSHFDMTSYPFGGHHAGEMGATMRKVLAIGGGKPTMPADQKGAVKGDDLAAIEAWVVAFEASRAGGAHEGMPGHGGHEHGHGDAKPKQGGHDHGSHGH